MCLQEGALSLCSPSFLSFTVCLLLYGICLLIKLSQGWKECAFSPGVHNDHFMDQFRRNKRQTHIVCVCVCVCVSVTHCVYVCVCMLCVCACACVTVCHDSDICRMECGLAQQTVLEHALLILHVNGCFCCDSSYISHQCSQAETVCLMRNVLGYLNHNWYALNKITNTITASAEDASASSERILTLHLIELN